MAQRGKKHHNNALKQQLDAETYIACSTCGYANSAPVMGSRTYPFVLVDEAAQAAEPEVIIPMSRLHGGVFCMVV